MRRDTVTPDELRVLAKRVTDYKAILERQMLAAGLPPPDREYRFARLADPPRAYRFDWCWPGRMVAAEYEGGTYGGKSRHTTAAGFREDCVKYSLAAELGWRVLRYTSDHVRSGAAVAQLARVLAPPGP